MPKDEIIVSTNPSPVAAISVAPINTKDQPATSETSGALTTMHPFNTYTPQEQGYYIGGSPFYSASLVNLVTSTILRQWEAQIENQSFVSADPTLTFSFLSEPVYAKIYSEHGA